MVKVKICGITNLDDAREAVESGADALGFNFVRPPRRITPEKAKEIIGTLPAEVCKVGVFVNADARKVEAIIRESGLTAVQFHGDETPGYCAKFSGQVKVIKAFRVRDEEDLKAMGSYNADFYLLDARTEKKGEETLWGGSGETFDWDLALKAKRFGRPVILAGGLNPDNVREAIEAVHPFAVDVSSGVENAPGRKDLQLMKKFIRQAKIE